MAEYGRMTWPFGDLRPGSYDVAVVDWPWAFASNSKAKPGRNARRHYPTLKPKQAPEYPIGELLKPDAEVFFWITTPFYVAGAHLPMFKAWGLKPCAQAFTWVKLRPNAAPLFFMEQDLHVGPGFTTRKNTEVCLLARPKRGKSIRLSKKVHEVIFAPLREHSPKPEQSRDRIEEYVGPGRRVVELFCREKRTPKIVDCWDVWGNEVTKFDKPEV